MKWLAVVLFSQLLVGCLDPGDWQTVATAIDQKYPDIQTISTSELAAWRARTDTTQPLILDVRSDDEFAVSHLPGARHAPDIEAALSAIDGWDGPIVVYCSVGYRSAKLAAELHERGHDRIRNLEGSIFRWANERRPLVDAEGATTFVHPYGSPWSRLLEAQHHAGRSPE